MFRLLLVPAAFMVFRMFEFPSTWAAAMAAVCTSFLFAMAHHIGPSAEALNLFAFTFRAAAGLFFARYFPAAGFRDHGWLPCGLRSARRSPAGKSAGIGVRQDLPNDLGRYNRQTRHNRRKFSDCFKWQLSSGRRFDRLRCLRLFSKSNHCVGHRSPEKNHAIASITLYCVESCSIGDDFRRRSGEEPVRRMGSCSKPHAGEESCSLAVGATGRRRERG
jgi:hypothetical protein